MAFDAVAYKETTRQQWEDAAPAWHRWGPTLERWLGPATDRMLELAGVRAGSRVLDVAAGAGGQSIAAARRSGPSGAVVATDISPKILEFASVAATEAGQTITTVEADGEHLDQFPDGSFDAVISRLGLIYLPDQPGAVRGVRRVLREGGRFAAVVYAGADRNEFFSIPVSIIRDRAQLPAPQPGQPGPFSMGDPERLSDLLAANGFTDVRVESVAAPLRLASAVECVRFERESFGALHQMLGGVAEAERGAVWDDIAHALARFENGHGFAGPCELLVVSGTR